MTTYLNRADVQVMDARHERTHCTRLWRAGRQVGAHPPVLVQEVLQVRYAWVGGDGQPELW